MAKSNLVELVHPNLPGSIKVPAKSQKGLALSGWKPAPSRRPEAAPAAAPAPSKGDSK